MYFKNYVTVKQFNELMLNSKQFIGEYRNSIVYKNSEKSLSIKEIKCKEPFPNDIKSIKASLGWTELYFVCLLSCEPNFVNYKGFHYNGKKLYIISEWVPNSLTLCDYLEKPRDFYECYQVLLQVFVCLEILYKKFKIVHNDCIPSNIILEKIESTDDFVFKFQKNSYHVKNVGYKVYLWDFSFSSSDLVWFYDLDIILNTLKRREIPEKFRDMNWLVRCLQYKKYQDNVFYSIFQNWIYRYYYTNTVLGMCENSSGPLCFIEY